jgi:hypothetical protein
MGLENIALMKDILIGDEGEDGNALAVSDQSLLDELSRFSPAPGQDTLKGVFELVRAHMAKTRQHIRSVLIGGADGRKNNADVMQTI